MELSFYCPVAELRHVQFSAYRTALKSRRIQKALCCECFLAAFFFLPASNTAILPLNAKTKKVLNTVWLLMKKIKSNLAWQSSTGLFS